MGTVFRCAGRELRVSSAPSEVVRAIYYVNDTAMMRTILILAGPFWFGLALVFLSSLMLCVLKRMPSPPWRPDDGGDSFDREDGPAPFDLNARRSEAVCV